MTNKELKKAVEVVANERGLTEIEIITEMQAGAAMTKDETTLEMLCDLKWDYI
jgi:hypothetical protein